MTAETPRPASLRDRMLLQALRTIPAPLARHLMFPAGPDSPSGRRPTDARATAWKSRLRSRAGEAAKRNRIEGHAVELTCIEPFPQPRLTKEMPRVTLIQKPVEEVDPAVFEALHANDLLFIDSSHAVKFGGDVCREFLEILPRLAPGVWVHVHDIFFPQDYPARWLIDQPDVVTELCAPALRADGDLGFGSFWMQRV